MSRLATIMFCMVAVVALIVTVAGAANDYAEPDEEAMYASNFIDDLQGAPQQKRACIRQSGNCDHRPNDCCYNSSCRCNLWGSNCRCQRMGLFQKWG